MGVRNIKKQLAGVEDLLLGVGTQVQERNSGNVPITKINLVGIVDTVEALATLDITKYTTAIVKDLDRGGTFEWSATGTANGGTVFAGVSGYWNRQYSGAVNVKWFGAKGDGVTDDTLAIQKAINSGAKTVMLQSNHIINGTLTLVENIEITSEVSIEGNDTLFTIKKTTVGDLLKYDSSPSAKGLVIRNITLDGGSVATNGISILSYRNLIENVKIKNFTSSGIVMPDSALWCGESTFSNLLIYGCDIGFNTGLKCLDSTLENSYIYNCRVGVQIAEDGGWTINSNHLYANTEIGMSILSTSSGRITGNLFDTFYVNALKIVSNEASTSTIIDGNIFTTIVSTTRIAILLVINTSCKIKISNNAFYSSNDTNHKCIQKSGAGTLFGTINNNMLSNLSYANAYTIDSSTEMIENISSTLYTKASNITMGNSVTISSGFGNPSSTPAQGSFYSAYNTSDTTAKGASFIYYGGWKKLPTLDKWHTDGTAAPTTGTWSVGDIVYNEAPTAGGFIGWVCITAGTPGTWKTFGAITA